MLAITAPNEESATHKDSVKKEGDNECRCVAGSVDGLRLFLQQVHERSFGVVPAIDPSTLRKVVVCK